MIRVDKENLFYNLELQLMVIISFVPVSSKCDFGGDMVRRN